jgi:hypothetical protein
MLGRRGAGGSGRARGRRTGPSPGAGAAEGGPTGSRREAGGSPDGAERPQATASPTVPVGSCACSGPHRRRGGSVMGGVDGRDRGPSGPAAAAERLLERWIGYLRDHEPVEASRLGLTDRDEDLPDLTGPALDARARALSGLAAGIEVALASLGSGTASAAAREAAGDLRLLRDTVAWRQVELEDRPRHALDPVLALDTVAVGVHALLRTDGVGPDEERRRILAAVRRVRRVPAFLEVAGAALSGMTTPSFRVAVQRLPGLVGLVRDLLPRRALALGLDVDAARDAGEYAAEGLEAFGALLDVLVDDRRIDWRVGPVHHERALRLAVGVTMSAGELEDRARTVLAETRARMLELAGARWARLRPGQPRPESEQALLRAALDDVAAAAVPAHRLVREARDAVEEARAFCADWGALPVPAADSLRVETMPEELRGVAVAFLTGPQPLRPGTGGTYHLTTVPERWDEEQRRSFLREYHPAQLRSLAVHEAYPGHHLQLMRQAEHPRLARRLLSRGVFVEGWAVTVERAVLDAGFGLEGTSRVPREDLELIQLRMQLRVAANALLDLGLHAASMTDADATSLLTGAALQEEAEAQGKLLRAKVTSGQLCSYFAGAEELADLRSREERRLGADFDADAHLRALLEHGAPTVPLLADALVATVPAAGAVGTWVDAAAG